jgi:hypothetical protein
MDVDFDDLTDEQLAGVTIGEDGAVTLPEAAAPAEEPDDEQPAEEPAAGEEPPAEPPAPAGDTAPEPPASTVPLPEHMAMRQRAQAAEAERDAARREAALVKERADLQAKYDRLADEQGQAAADAWLDGEITARQREAQAEARAEAKAEVKRLQDSAQRARQTFGEERFQAAYTRLEGIFGKNQVEARAGREADPGAWVVDFAENHLAPGPEKVAAQQAENAKLIQAEVAKQVAAALLKNKPPEARAGAGGVTHIASSPAPALEDMDPDDMTDAQLKKASAEARKRSLG